jgi:hypothetical protein
VISQDSTWFTVQILSLSIEQRAAASKGFYVQKNLIDFQDSERWVLPQSWACI